MAMRADCRAARRDAPPRRHQLADHLGPDHRLLVARSTELATTISSFGPEKMAEKFDEKTPPRDFR
jgi:hypothetical protein